MRTSVIPGENLPEALIIGEFPYPTGSPASNALQGHAAAIQKSGATVGVVSLVPASNGESGPKIFRGAKCWEIPSQKAALTLKNSPLRRLSIGDERIAWLRARRLSGVRAVFVYPGMESASFIFQLRRLCRAHNVQLYVYVAEWHALRHYPKGVTGCFQTIDSEFLRRCLIPKLDGAICFAEPSERYYVARGCKAVVLPPLLDLSDPKWNMSQTTPESQAGAGLRFLFSGTPRRDRQDIILRAAHQVRSRGIPVAVEYLGSSREDIAALPGVGDELLRKLGKGVVFHGRVPDEQVARMTASASFGILLREQANWSACCFPSKVPEFLAHRVPIMCNLTSDLGKYLADGFDSVVVKEMSIAGMCEAFERATRLSPKKLAEMKLAARKTAERFDASHFANAYQELIFGSLREGRAKSQVRLAPFTS